MTTPQERRRLRDVFGDDTDQTSDDQPGPDENPVQQGIDDDWWQAQRPPHHE